MRPFNSLAKTLADVKSAAGRLTRQDTQRAPDSPPISGSDASLSAADNTVVIELNPGLDCRHLAEQFQRTGRVRIANVLTDAAAARLLHALEGETPWGLIYNKGKQAFEFADVTPEKHQRLVVAAWQRAHTEFQYIHHHCRLSEREKHYLDQDHYLEKLAAFLSTPQFCAFVREVTGRNVVALQSSTATLFKPLHFLTVHDDRDGGDSRLVAFSLNLTPEWRPDWGGALQFYDRKDHIEEGYLPTFNALNLFSVPKAHSVTQVAAFGGMRYSVVGWFESGKAQ